MAPAPSFERSSHASADDNEKHREFDKEVREMVSNLTTRLGMIRKGTGTGTGSSQSHHHEVVDDQGASVITLAGTNTGATMRTELNGKSSTKLDHQEETSPDHHENEALSSYINSNFQAINNSIMFGGSYTGNDPGVHMDISDLSDESLTQKSGSKAKKFDKDQAHAHANEFSGNRYGKE